VARSLTSLMTSLARRRSFDATGTFLGLATTASCSSAASSSGDTSPGRTKRTIASAERSRLAATGTKKIGSAYSELLYVDW
jgi:hypothetical protein